MESEAFMSIWDSITQVAGYIAVGVADAFQDLTMDPMSGSMKAELIILARKAQGKKTQRISRAIWRYLNS